MFGFHASAYDRHYPCPNHTRKLAPNPAEYPERKRQFGPYTNGLLDTFFCNTHIKSNMKQNTERPQRYIYWNIIIFKSIRYNVLQDEKHQFHETCVSFFASI